ncbi:MAG: OsmC family peroxiredoxin [Bdellovibrionaceae bacterium]|nr:OsmC family peroxiredoxin [Pseudobdellovibrionaceae bacterium]
MADRKSTALWTGSLKNGHGVVSGESGAFHHAPYSARSRFETKDGTETQQTNPEELIAAAHASCFSMAVANNLESAGFQPKSLDVTASVTLEKTKDSWSIPSVHLILHAQVPDASEGDFRDLVQRAKETCPVSRLLNANISWEAHLNAEPSKTHFHHETRVDDNRPV